MAAPMGPSPLPVGQWHPPQYCWKAALPLAASPPACATPPVTISPTRLAIATPTTRNARIVRLLVRDSPPRFLEPRDRFGIPPAQKTVRKFEGSNVRAGRRWLA